MQILITNVVDTGLITGVIAVFLLIDIIAKNNLKIGIKDIGADLATGALAIQLAFTITLLADQEMEYFSTHIVLGICFAATWGLCLWLPAKNGLLGNVFSYILGALALSLSILQVLGTADITGIVMLVATSMLLAAAGFLFADYLNSERINQEFLDLTRGLNTYEMSEDYRKIDSGKSVFDPLQPAIDIIRTALKSNDDLTAIKGISALGTFGSAVLISEGNKSLILKNLNSQFYSLGIFAEKEDRIDITKEIVCVLGDLGSKYAEKGMNNLVMQVTEHLHNLFNLHKVRDPVSSEGRVSLVKKANRLRDVYEALIDSQASTPRHEFVTAADRICQAAAAQKMLEPVERSVSFLKAIALNAVSDKDIHTLEHVSKALVDIAATVKENRLEPVEKQIIVALRDICMKAVQESPDKKRNDSLQTVVAALRETGHIFGTSSHTEITGCLKDIGVTAARKHSDKKVSDIITHIEYFCHCAAEMDLDEEASVSVNALMCVCEASIKEQMVESTALSSKTFADLSKKETLTVLVNDAVFEIEKYRELDREMFALFEKTYKDSGGR